VKLGSSEANSETTSSRYFNSVELSAEADELTKLKIDPAVLARSQFDFADHPGDA
jgi:hypothetical protein